MRLVDRLILAHQAAQAAAEDAGAGFERGIGEAFVGLDGEGGRGGKDGEQGENGSHGLVSMASKGSSSRSTISAVSGPTMRLRIWPARSTT